MESIWIAGQIENNVVIMDHGDVGLFDFGILRVKHIAELWQKCC